MDSRSNNTSYDIVAVFQEKGRQSAHKFLLLSPFFHELILYFSEETGQSQKGQGQSISDMMLLPQATVCWEIFLELIAEVVDFRVMKVDDPFSNK